MQEALRALLAASAASGQDDYEGTLADEYAQYSSITAGADEDDQPALSAHGKRVLEYAQTRHDPARSIFGTVSAASKSGGDNPRLDVSPLVCAGAQMAYETALHNVSEIFTDTKRLPIPSVLRVLTQADLDVRAASDMGMQWNMCRPGPGDKADGTLSAMVALTSVTIAAIPYSEQHRAAWAAMMYAGDATLFQGKRNVSQLHMARDANAELNKLHTEMPDLFQYHTLDAGDTFIHHSAMPWAAIGAHPYALQSVTFAVNPNEDAHVAAWHECLSHKGLVAARSFGKREQLALRVVPNNNTDDDTTAAWEGVASKPVAWLVAKKPKHVVGDAAIAKYVQLVANIKALTDQEPLAWNAKWAASAEKAHAEITAIESGARTTAMAQRLRGAVDRTQAHIDTMVQRIENVRDQAAVLARAREHISDIKRAGLQPAELMRINTLEHDMAEYEHNIAIHVYGNKNQTDKFTERANALVAKLNAPIKTLTMPSLDEALDAPMKPAIFLTGIAVKKLEEIGAALVAFIENNAGLMDAFHDVKRGAALLHHEIKAMDGLASDVKGATLDITRCVVVDDYLKACAKSNMEFAQSLLAAPAASAAAAKPVPEDMDEGEDVVELGGSDDDDDVEEDADDEEEEEEEEEASVSDDEAAAGLGMDILHDADAITLNKAAKDCGCYDAEKHGNMHRYQFVNAHCVECVQSELNELELRLRELLGDDGNIDDSGDGKEHFLPEQKIAAHALINTLLDDLRGIRRITADIDGFTHPIVTPKHFRPAVQNFLRKLKDAEKSLAQMYADGDPDVDEDEYGDEEEEDELSSDILDEDDDGNVIERSNSARSSSSSSSSNEQEQHTPRRGLKRDVFEMRSDDESAHAILVAIEHTIKALRAQPELYGIDVLVDGQVVPGADCVHVFATIGDAEEKLRELLQATAGRSNISYKMRVIHQEQRQATRKVNAQEEEDEEE